MHDPDVRVLLLPADVHADVVRLNGDAESWLTATRPAPYGGATSDLGAIVRATSSALVRHDHPFDDGTWSEYVALRRHGGLEAARSDMSWTRAEHGPRIFALRRLVAFVWCVVALQDEATVKWEAVHPPFELTVALRGTHGAVLGFLAEGWRDPATDFMTHEFRACVEDHVLLRLELSSVADPEDIATDVGDRIENAFGTTHQRYRANRGEFEGRFDPRGNLLS